MSEANAATEFKDVVGSLDELRALMGEPSEIGRASCRERVYGLV